MPVSDLEVAMDRYTRFFGRAADMVAGDEVLWDIDEHAEPVETYENGVRHVMVPDPDGNAIALAESPPSA